MSPVKALQFDIFSQFLALLYKELLFRKRHFIASSFEVIFPIIIASVPWMLYKELNSIDSKGQGFTEVNFTTFDPLDPMTLYNGGSWHDLEFVYAPSNDVTDEFMDDSFRAFFGRSYQPIPVKMNSEEDLRKYILEEQKRDEGKKMIGTVFKGFEVALPKDLDYKIYYTKDFDTLRKYEINGPGSNTDYKYSFFVQWQTAVGDTFIQKKSTERNKQIFYKIFLQTFPYPEYKSNPSGWFPLFNAEFYINVALTLFVAAIVRRIIQEKNDGSKELMETMGLSKSSYWASTFMNNFVIAFIFTLVISIIYKTAGKNTVTCLESDFLLLFIILLLFVVNLILFCMTFSIFFNRVAYAVIALLTVHFVSLRLLASVLYGDTSFVEYFSLSLFHKLCICLYPGGSLITFFVILRMFESGNEGIKWKNVTEYTMVPDINLLMVTAMMVFSIFSYIFFIWYLDAVWPWQPGMRKKCYFFLTKSYWRGETPIVPDEIELASNENSVDTLEAEPKRDLRSVVIKDLSKVIRKGSSSKVVLNITSFRCSQGQITALVGGSEAGKTSLFNILTGKEFPTKGSISISGMNISTSVTQKLLGVCPQRSVLYDELTVEQHLKLYAAMKGTSLGLLTYESEKVLNSVTLSNKRNEMVSNLSYAEKRKLSLAIAIVGGSKVLLFDEPTHGLDNESKRHVWDALQAIKHDRTVIVTTQSFEEADALGDRVAVMVAGEIQSCGTPAFMKQKLAAGYHLHVMKDVKFDLQGLEYLIAKHVSAATCENESHEKASFILGDGCELGDLFEELDSRKTDLGIVSYDVSLSTIRDVSLKVSNMSHTKESPSTGGATENTDSEADDVSRDSFPPAVQASLSNQFRALLLKHFHSCKRRWKFHTIQLAVPFILMLVCFYCIRGSIKDQYPPLKFDISSVYGATDGFYYNRDPSLSNLAGAFKNVLESNDVDVKKVSEPTHHVLNYGKKNLAKYLKRLVVGGAFDSIRSGFFNLTAWHNSGSRHSMPMSILLMQTALLRHVTNTGSISLTLEPVIPLRDKYNAFVSSFSSAELAGLFVPFALTFLSLSFIFAPAHERATGAKLLQLMSGIPAAAYWIAIFLWDYLIYIIVCIFLIMVPAFFFPSVFFGMHSEAIGTLLVLLFLYGWASLPLGYIVSILLKRENRGLSIFISCCILFSVVSIFLLENISLPFYRDDLKQMTRISRVNWVFRLFPLYSISKGAQINFRFAFSNAACDMFTPKDLTRCESLSPRSSPTLLRCCEDICGKTINVDDYFDDCHKTMNHLSMKKYGPLMTMMSNGPEALFLGLEGIICFAILFFLETRTATKFLNIIKFHLQRMWNQITQIFLRGQQALRDENITEDPQVLLEEESIRNLTATQQGSCGKALAILGLTKNCENFSTVNRLTFGVNGEECFGILGVKGAGKTTTFRILTGDDMPSKGNAFIKTYSLIGDFRKFRSLIGYCPEVDPFVVDLTGREVLSLFGRLRGLSDHALQKNVNELIQSMGLTNCADELAQFYSGGDRRKLSVAIALVGSPPVILLDEPTAGVGHESRQQIWKALTRARKRATILLATQSIEESEALCNRLAIMVNGRFRRLGSAEQLKSKDGQGHVLTIKLSKGPNNLEAMNALKTHMQNSLKNATLTDQYQGILQYHMVDPSMTVGYLFKFMSDVKTQFELEDYLISVISLEKIFHECFRA